MPSRRGKTFRNRVAWAKQYLGYATLIVSVRRGAYHATDLGRRWAKERTGGLKIADFKAIPGFDERVHGEAFEPTEAAAVEVVTASTPDERIEAAEVELRQAMISTLLERIGQKPPRVPRTARHHPNVEAGLRRRLRRVDDAHRPYE
jgi:restriction system protein